MKIYYDDRTDLLYLRFDDRKHQVVNKKVTEDIVLDVDEHDRIIGIEILDASQHLSLEALLPIHYDGVAQKIPASSSVRLAA